MESLNPINSKDVCLQKKLTFLYRYFQMMRMSRMRLFDGVFSSVLVSSTHLEPWDVTKVKLLPEYCTSQEGYDINSSIGSLAAFKLADQS